MRAISHAALTAVIGQAAKQRCPTKRVPHRWLPLVYTACLMLGIGLHLAEDLIPHFHFSDFRIGAEQPWEWWLNRLDPALAIIGCWLIWRSTGSLSLTLVAFGSILPDADYQPAIRHFLTNVPWYLPFRHIHETFHWSASAHTRWLGVACEATTLVISVVALIKRRRLDA